MTSRSTLGDQHTIPLFYACYLLRSIKTKSSRSTYVGSTPDPPRRLRQHNGEISQGAYKTRRGRPWSMTMIVYGFPSKLAALQFEWAWQHPYISRHLRVSQTKKGKEISSQIFKRDSKANLLKTKILVARTMLPIPPYSTWPLHVKIFTQEAKQLWDEIQGVETNEPLPEGLTISVELEGVDGKAANPTSQRSSTRIGPIDVKDSAFNSSHIHKYQSLVNKGFPLSCSVCGLGIDTKHLDHLRVALCPQASCMAVSHLDCLAGIFLEHPSNPPGLIPRGGECGTCNQYILWGDVVRGCYRRARGGLQQPTSEQESDEDDNEESVQIGDEMSSHMENLQIGGPLQRTKKPPAVRATTSKKNKPVPAPRVTKRGAQKGGREDSDVENFAAEMDAIDCDTEDSGPERPSRKDPATTASRRKVTRPAQPKVIRDDGDRPRDMDEIVRRALGDLSILAPSGSYQARSTKSARAKSPVATKLPKFTSTKSRVRVINEEQLSRTADPERKGVTLATASRSRKRRTPSPEYIDLEGI